MILSLPLAPFEKYMLIDDRPTHPMSFFLKLTFSGPCDPGMLDAALRTALGRHPLLSAKVAESKRHRFTWTLETHEDVAVRWDASDAKTSAPHIDLFAEPGLRVSARRLEAGLELVLQVHHACCDAIAALQFIEDWLMAYADGFGDEVDPDSFRSLDERRLPDRDHFGLTRRKLLLLAHQQAVGLWGVGQFLLRQPVSLQPIEPTSVAAALNSDFPAARGRPFSQSETAALVAAARKSGATVNDLLIRDLFLAMGDFRARKQLGTGQEWLRIPTPINLRTAEDERLSATNVVGMVFLDRRPAEIDDRTALLAGIERQMREIKEKRLGLIFPLSLRLACALPGAIPRMRRAAKKATCHGTAVLSNLGQPMLAEHLPRSDEKLVAGGMTLERIEFLPPIRPYTLAAFGAITYANQLHLTLHFDSRGLSTADAEELLNHFAGRLIESGQTCRS